MANYLITDNATGKKFKVTGDSPPSEMEMAQIFKDMGGKAEKAPPKLQDMPQDYKDALEQFIRAESPRDIKQEAVRGLPMGNRIADATLGQYNDPMRPQQTIARYYGPQTESKTTGGSILRGLSNLITNPAPQIEGAIAFPADLATGAYQAATSPEKGSLSKFAGETVKGMAAPLGLADLASGDMSFPLAREAWENNALGSGLMAYGGARGTVGAGRSLKDLGGGAVEKVGLTPEKLYASSLKQSTVIPMEQRASNVKAGLDGGYVPNKKGLNRLMDNINEINNEIGNKINESAKGGKTVPVEDIISRLDDVKQRAVDSFGDNKSVLSKIDEYADSLREHPSVVDGQIPINVAQKMKTNTYKQLKNSYGELKGFEVEAKKAMARGAKEEIVSQIPELAELNAKDSTLINLEKVLFKAVNRIENRDIISIGTPIKAIAGGAGGIKGSIAGALIGVLDAPTIKANLAIALHKARGKRPSNNELNTTINNIKTSLQEKLKDERGLVGKDINKNQYIYHGTGEGAFRKIRENGLNPNSANGKIYASDSQKYASTYSNRKGAPFGDRILRVKKDGFEKDTSNKGGDYVSTKNIPPSEIEIFDNGKWVPIADYANENIGIMKKNK